MKRQSLAWTVIIALFFALLVTPVTDKAFSSEKPTMWKGKYRQIEGLSGLNSDAIIIKAGGVQSGDLVIDVKVKKKKNYTTQLWNSNNNASQRFSLVKNNDGTYRIIVLKHGKALTSTGTARAGATVVADKYKGRNCQKWRLSYDGSSRTFVFASVANRSLYLGTSRLSRSSKLQLVNNNGKIQFSFLSPCPSIPNGTYTFLNKANKEFKLTVKGNSKKKGARIQIRRGGSSNSQMFRVIWNKRVGYYTIRNLKSGKAVDVKKAKTKSGTPVQQWNNTGKFSQYWLIEHTRDGNGYYIRYAVNGMQLSVKKGKMKKGAAVVISKSSGAKKKAWLVRKAAPGNRGNNTGSKLKIPTNWYGKKSDGFQAYHPKAVSFDEAWNGYRYWMAYTPYPDSNADYEDPCIAVSNDLVNWKVPNGLKNPVHDTHNDGVYGWHNSDTHLLYNQDTQRLELYWRYVKGGSRIIYRSTSDNGVDWSDKEIVIQGTTSSDIISPAIIYDEGSYRLWYVKSDRGEVCYRESANGTDWTQETKVYIPYSYTEMKTWHLDVEKTSKGYEALLSAYDEWDNRNRMDLWYSRSPDGVNSWSVPTVVLRPTTGSKYWDNMGIYRSCMLTVDGKYYVFYGGTSTKYAHGIGLMCGTSLDKLSGIN